jgi:hypothetical protein
VCPLELATTDKCTDSWQITTAESVADGTLDITIGMGVCALRSFISLKLFAELQA